MSSHFIVLICLLHTPRQLTCHQKRCPVHFTPSSLRDALKSNVKRWTLPSKTCFDAPSAQTPFIETEKLKSMIERLNSQQKKYSNCFYAPFHSHKSTALPCKFQARKGFFMPPIALGSDNKCKIHKHFKAGHVGTSHISHRILQEIRSAYPVITTDEHLLLRAACTNFSRAAKGVRYSRLTLSAASSPL